MDRQHFFSAEPEQGGHRCCCRSDSEDEAFVFLVRRRKFPRDISAATVSSKVCMCVCISHKIKHCFTHCCIVVLVCKCILLLCDVCVNCGNLNSFSFMIKVKLLHSFAQFYSIFRNNGLALSWYFVCMCQCVNSCVCVSVFLNNDRLWLHRGVW